MKKHAKRLSIILTLALILTSFEFLSVFAAVGDVYTVIWKNWDGTVLEKDENVPYNTTPTYDKGTPTRPDEGDKSYSFTGWDPEVGPATGDPDTEIVYTAQYAVTNAQAPATPTLYTYSSYNSIHLEWTKVDNPNKTGSFAGAAVWYRLYCGDTVIYDGPDTSYHHLWLDPFSSYSYRVQAYLYGKSKDSAISGYMIDSPVRPMRYVLTVKRSGTLKSHAGRKQSLKVTKGQIIYADRFQTGKYIFDYNGSTFYIARTRVGKKRAEYWGAGAWNYSTREAEYYVRDRGLTSSTGVLIWVCTYTQHVYYFNYGSDGWVCTDDWECSTGTASTPTPSGINGIKAIKKKIKKKNGIKWWSTFNGNAALHGRKKNKPVGDVASNGCVRNPEEKAYIIYAYAGKGTRVMIY